MIQDLPAMLSKLLMEQLTLLNARTNVLKSQWLYSLYLVLKVFQLILQFFLCLSGPEIVFLFSCSCLSTEGEAVYDPGFVSGPIFQNNTRFTGNVVATNEATNDFMFRGCQKLCAGVPAAKFFVFGK
jgi:hypothetical protein